MGDAPMALTLALSQWERGRLADFNLSQRTRGVISRESTQLQHDGVGQQTCRGTCTVTTRGTHWVTV